jgi:hypothetical protein
MTPSPPLRTPERPLSATRLAQYVTVRGRCERYLRLALFPSEGEALMHRYGLRPEALSPLLAEAGSVFEQAAVAQLATQANVIDLRHQSAQACIDTIRGQPVGRALYSQATLTGRIGAVDCEGIADVLDHTFRPPSDGEPRLFPGHFARAQHHPTVVWCRHMRGDAPNAVAPGVW